MIALELITRNTDMDRDCSRKTNYDTLINLY